jgi:hypothetical protein
MKSKLFGVIFLSIFCYCISHCQKITIEADKYLQEFEGGGVSIGLYLGHHFSMTQVNQDKALSLINKDLRRL